MRTMLLEITYFSENLLTAFATEAVCSLRMLPLRTIIPKISGAELALVWSLFWASVSPDMAYSRCKKSEETIYIIDPLTLEIVF